MSEGYEVPTELPGSTGSKVSPPSRSEVKQNTWYDIFNSPFKLYPEEVSVLSGETYTATEAPKEEFGVYYNIRRWEKDKSVPSAV